MSDIQKALLLTEIGKPLVETSDHPVPQPGPGQALIKVAVAGINPHDQKWRDWGLIVADLGLPVVLTNDVVGRVVAVGEGVTKYVIGDRVVSQAGVTSGGVENGLQEYALVNAGSSTKIPDSVSDDDAATIPTNLIAPLVGIFSTLEIPAPWTAPATSFDYANTTLLIVGGGSNCGKFAVQLASLAGIGRIVVVGGKEQELKSYGATHVLDRHGGDDAVLLRIHNVVGDDLVYAIDCVNGPDGQVLTLNALSSHKKGAMARLVPISPVDESKVIGKNAGFEARDVFGSSAHWPDLAGPFWDELPRYLTTGKIRSLAYTTKKGLTAENVNEILDRYRDGKPVVQVHIHI